MQPQSGEHDDITKLLRDAFVRICQLAVADCGLSVAELTLHLSIQVNTGVPVVLRTTVVETVSSSPANESDRTDYSAASGSEALRQSRRVNDNNSNRCRDDEKAFAVVSSFCSSVHTNDTESQDFNETVTAGSLPGSCTSKGTYVAATDGQLVSSPVDVASVHSLILSEDDHGEVPLDEFLADVEKSGDCDEYVVNESPVALLGIEENKQETTKVYGSSRTSLPTLVSSDNGGCLLSTLQSYDSDVLSQCISDNIVYNSGSQCNTSNTSFLQHCRFGEQDTARSDSAFHSLSEVAGSTRAVDELSGSDGDETEVDGLSASQQSSLYDYGNTADRSSDRNDNSYEEELVVDESDAGTHSFHTAPTESSSTALCSPINIHPACIESAAFIKDVSLLKPYTTMLCFGMFANDFLAQIQVRLSPNLVSHTLGYRGLGD